MDHRLLTPRWLTAHAAVVVAIVACGLLGWWQLDRAREQHAQSLLPALNAAAEAVPLETVLPPGERLRAQDVGRTVTVGGRYDESAQLLVPGRALAGASGFAVVTPFVVDGSAIAVVRGWVAAEPDGAAPADVPAPPPGDVVVTGRLGASEGPPALDESLPPGQIGSVHLPSLVNLVPYPLYDAVLSRTAEAPAPSEAIAALAPPEPTADGRWPLQNVFYAIEWWVFGLAAAAMWLSAVRRREPEPITAAVTAGREAPVPPR